MRLLCSCCFDHALQPLMPQHPAHMRRQAACVQLCTAHALSQIMCTLLPYAERKASAIASAVVKLPAVMPASWNASCTEDGAGPAAAGGHV